MLAAAEAGGLVSRHDGVCDVLLRTGVKSVLATASLLFVVRGLCGWWQYLTATHVHSEVPAPACSAPSAKLSFSLTLPVSACLCPALLFSRPRGLLLS